MLSYEFTKLLHITFAFVFIGMAAVNLLAAKNKWHGITMGLASVGTLIVGMALIGVLRAGMNYWMVAKLVIWIGLMALIGVTNKRFPKYKTQATTGVFLLAALAVYFAVYKPF